MQQQSKIEQQVMASVGTIYAGRQLVSSTALKLYVCALSLFGLGKLVFVERVRENFLQSGPEHALEFLSSALLNTDPVVQATLAVFVVAGVWLARDLTRLTVPSQRWA